MKNMMFESATTPEDMLFFSNEQQVYRSCVWIIVVSPLTDVIHHDSTTMNLTSVAPQMRRSGFQPLISKSLMLAPIKGRSRTFLQICIYYLLIFYILWVFYAVRRPETPRVLTTLPVPSMQCEPSFRRDRKVFEEDHDLHKNPRKFEGSTIPLSLSSTGCYAWLDSTQTRKSKDSMPNGSERLSDQLQ